MKTQDPETQNDDLAHDPAWLVLLAALLFGACWACGEIGRLLTKETWTK